eukprot:gnl/MRDRNA2_/MRDRNA2_103009_c0_seq1.p1 gnl/MRDRNA2_/MRDRNA2_103009_c0~~gnl/MRDRNA2_/MRDRNA2_103009_c0_seq1.p1  ORF type:complete len:557 (-),score=175.90 gnl/MRDRNA2_/MRDRNA2_103009_c0_seq1:212-1882(-)
MQKTSMFVAQYYPPSRKQKAIYGVACVLHLVSAAHALEKTMLPKVRYVGPKLAFKSSHSRSSFPAPRPVIPRSHALFSNPGSLPIPHVHANVPLLRAPSPPPPGSPEDRLAYQLEVLDELLEGIPAAAASTVAERAAEARSKSEELQEIAEAAASAVLHATGEQEAENKAVEAVRAATAADAKAQEASQHAHVAATAQAAAEALDVRLKTAAKKLHSVLKATASAKEDAEAAKIAAEVAGRAADEAKHRLESASFPDVASLAGRVATAREPNEYTQAARSREQVPAPVGVEISSSAPAPVGAEIRESAPAPVGAEIGESAPAPVGVENVELELDHLQMLLEELPEAAKETTSRALASRVQAEAARDKADALAAGLAETASRIDGKAAAAEASSAAEQAADEAIAAAQHAQAAETAQETFLEVVDKKLPETISNVQLVTKAAQEGKDLAAVVRTSFLAGRVARLVEAGEKGREETTSAALQAKEHARVANIAASWAERVANNAESGVKLSEDANAKTMPPKLSMLTIGLISFLVGSRVAFATFRLQRTEWLLATTSD